MALFSLAKRFVAGATIACALNVARTLQGQGLSATLDFLGEDVEKPQDAQAVHQTYLRLLDAIRAEGLRANVSLKLSALGLTCDEALCRSHLRSIVEHAAHNLDPFVRIDMEGSAFTQKTLDIFEDVRAEHPNVGPVIQAYLKRSPGDIERLIAMGARVRLCKGAYRESGDIAIRDARELRSVYATLAHALLSRGVHPAIATHDEELIGDACSYAAQHGIDPKRFEFQMLYGVRPERQRSLAAAGYTMRVYIPFGTHCEAYLHRRIRERKENLFFALRALFWK